MKPFTEKVREHRGRLGLSQQELADKAGIGVRTLTYYECGKRFPQAAQLYKLAKALGVSTEYLKNDEIEDPGYGMDRMDYVEEMRQKGGRRESLDLEEMLRENQALFAGGAISEEAKDAYFQAVMKPKAAFVVSISRGLVISGILILVLPILAGASAIWFAMPVTELVVAVYVIYEMIKYTKQLRIKPN